RPIVVAAVITPKDAAARPVLAVAPSVEIGTRLIAIRSNVLEAASKIACRCGSALVLNDRRAQSRSAIPTPDQGSSVGTVLRAYFVEVSGTQEAFPLSYLNPGAAFNASFVASMVR